MANIVLINPRFEASFWGLEHALPLFGKRANMPVACLPLLAALTPAEHHITLLDENVEPLDFDRIARADIVGLTGMSVQRARAREILTELKRRNAFIVVGGPWVTVQEDYYEGLADVIFIGEAEETWPRFLTEWKQGRHAVRYEQSEKTDMTTLPVPRTDLLQMRHYLFGSVQFSRGCPFQCEFCDIIVTFGRRPRLKTSQQIMLELEALRRQKMAVVFIVDDNLIGNKKAIKPVLEEVAAWQKREGYPLSFFTEASLDLAEDEELVQLMIDANIQAVFIGIESPNEESLRETKKYQNLMKRGDTLINRVHKIQNAGLEVWCGMILGFDADAPAIFAAQQAFIMDSRIPHAMVGMLSAIPKTPLYDRLAAEGRLDREDHSEYGTNVIPLQMSRAELRDGYIRMMQDLYHPDAFFARLDSLYLRGNFQLGEGQRRYWRSHPLSGLKSQSANLLRAAVLYLRLIRSVPDRALRKEYARRIAMLVKARPDPTLLFFYVLKCAMHYHHVTMARQMTEGNTTLANSF